MHDAKIMQTLYGMKEQPHHIFDVVLAPEELSGVLLIRLHLQDMAQGVSLAVFHYQMHELSILVNVEEPNAVGRGVIDLDLLDSRQTEYFVGHNTLLYILL